jgi:hypothetical protein
MMMTNAREGDPLGMSKDEPNKVHPYWEQARKDGVAEYNRFKGIRQDNGKEFVVG